MKRNIDDIITNHTRHTKAKALSSKYRLASTSSSSSAPRALSQFETTRNDNDSIITAKTKFLRRVSSCISYLVDRHGYSRQRASSLILGEIRRSEPLPSEDEIFNAMEKMGIGMDQASDAIIVSKALKRIQKEQNLPPAQAIESLTSCLTTMKLLGKLESQSQSLPMKGRDELESGLSAARSSPSATSTTSSSVVTRTSPLQSSQATALDNSAISNMSEITSASLTSPRKNVKSGHNNSKRRLSKSAKQTRIRKEGDSNANNNNSSIRDSQPSSSANDDHTDLDPKVVQKVILQKTVGNGTAQNQGNNDPAPSTNTNNRIKSPSSKVSREKHDLDPIVQVQGQPTTKRQRLDSI